jgi:hypothetical protein
MKKHIIPAILAVTFTTGGVWGLYHKVEHTGWLLAVGVIIALFYKWD